MTIVPLWIVDPACRPIRDPYWWETQGVEFTTRYGPIVAYHWMSGQSQSALLVERMTSLRLLHKSVADYRLCAARCGKPGFDALRQVEAYSSSYTAYYDERDVNAIVEQCGEHCRHCGVLNRWAIDSEFCSANCKVEWETAANAPTSTTASINKTRRSCNG